MSGITPDPNHDPSDWMALEGALLAVLQSAVAGISPAVKVLGAAELAKVNEASAPSPAVHLIYAGYTPVEDAGSALMLEHRWIVAVAIKNAATLATGAAQRADVGRLQTQVIRAMLAAKLPHARSAVRLLAQPAARHQLGWRLEPHAFSVKTIFNKLAA